ncbi:hypothetical protein V6N13_033751 [Hibiscus sabdariffa]
MDSVTTSKERLEFVKVCVEIGMDTKIPYQIRVVLRDNSIVNVKVVIPCLPPSCQNCKTFGNSTKLCLVVEPKGVQVWRKKEVKGVVLVHECGETSTAGELRQEGSNLGVVLVKDLEEVLVHSGKSSLVAAPRTVLGENVDNIVVFADVGDNVSTDVGDGFVVSVGIGDNVVVSTDVGANVVVSSNVGDGVVMFASIRDNGVVSPDICYVHLQVVDTEFPTLQASVLKKKGRGRPPKDGKKLVGSSHVVDSLQSIEVDGDKKKSKNIVQELK